VLLGALRIIGRLLTVVTAAIVARGTAGFATVVGVVTASMFVLQRVLHASTKVAVQRDMYRATAHTFLAADAIGVDDANPEREFLAGIYNAGLLVYETIPGLIGDSVVLVIVIPWLLTVSPPRFVAIAALVIGALAAASFALRGRTREIERESAVAHRALLEQLFAAIDGRLEIIAAGRDREFAAGFDRALDEHGRLARRLGVASAFLGRAPLVAAGALVLVIVAFDESSREVLTRTLLSQALILAACLPAILGLVVGAHQLIRTRSQLGPFLALFDRPEREEKGSGAIALPAPFRADAITFSYDAKQAPVFTDLSFDWSTGALAALGPNGSGKSTLLRLLIGLRAPQSGSLTSGGVKLADIDLRAWRAGVAYLPQRPYLGEPYVTIRSSMRFAEADASDEAMLHELDDVGLRAMLHARDDVLGVKVGELSAGQRQRLGIARVLLQDAKLVILDEPDANLDAVGIQLVARLVARMKSEGKMVAIAAHTRELAEGADVVVDLTPT
jgi:ABC-type multidrug transport system fused ATPase/permease subunit